MSGQIPRGYEARPAHLADLDDVVGIFEAADAAFGLPFDPVRDFFQWIWGLPATDLDRDTRVVSKDGIVIGLAQGTGRPQDGGPLYFQMRIHPDHRDEPLEQWLCGWGEDLARERKARGILTEVVDRDGRAHDLLLARGYEQVRSSFTMWKELTPDQDPGTVPAGVEIRGFRPADERALYEVHEASFADHWGFVSHSFEAFNDEMYADDWDPSLAFLAEVDGAVVGHAVSFKLDTDGYVAMLGVVKAWRGRGIARALLQRSFAEIAGQGIREVRLGVDAQNPHGAVALYEGVGMTVRRRYDLFELTSA